MEPVGPIRIRAPTNTAASNGRFCAMASGMKLSSVAYAGIAPSSHGAQMIKRYPALALRFADKHIPEPNSGCWLWLGTQNGNGYGQFWTGERLEMAHRWSYEHHIGPVPDGLVLDHLCRVRSCVNPDHLEPVTHRENVLRGAGLPAQNVVKTHCPRGHPYSGTNLLSKERHRFCRICNQQKCREWRAKNGARGTRRYTKRHPTHWLPEPEPQQ